MKGTMSYDQVRVTSTRNFANVSLRHKNHCFSVPENVSLGQKASACKESGTSAKKVSLCRKSVNSTKKRLYVNEVTVFKPCAALAI